MINRSSNLPFSSRQAQTCIAIVLAVLLVATRGSHVASINALPGGSWAVFFLAGALLRPRWAFFALFALAVSVDFASLTLERIADTCMTPGYWMLLPAYALLWGGGRLYSRIHVERPATVLRLAAVMVVASVLAYQFSGGGYYLLSGTQPDPSVAEYVARVLKYLPQRLFSLSVYLAAAAAMYAAWRVAGRVAGGSAHARGA